MIRLKRLTAMILMAMVISLCAPQGYAGEMLTPPAATGEILTPGLNGWMSTGLYAGIVSLFI